MSERDIVLDGRGRELCSVVTKRGAVCRLPAGARTKHLGTGPCGLHGGNLPPVVKRGMRVLADQRLRAELAAFAVPLEGPVDPQQVVLQMVREAAGNVAWLGARVRELSTKDDELDLETGEDKEPGPGHGAKSWAGMTGYSRGAGLFGPRIDVDKEGDEHIVGEDVRGMVKLYGEWSDRLVKYAKMALDAGIAKAQVEAAKEQGQTIVIIVNRVLATLGMGEAQMEEARRLIAEEFRAQAVSEGQARRVSE